MRPNVRCRSTARSTRLPITEPRELTMQIFQLSSFPIEQVTNLEALELDLAAWFAARPYPIRLLAYSQAFNMRPAIARIQEAQAGMERIYHAVAPLLQS